MLKAETSGMRVASTNTLFTVDDIVSKARKAAPYVTFLMHESSFLSRSSSILGFCPDDGLMSS